MKLVSQSGESSVQQAVQLAGVSTHPTLSFLYKLSGIIPDNGSHFQATIDNGLSTTTVFSTTTNTSDWTHQWVDLTPWAGQQVTMTLGVMMPAGVPPVRAYLDDVTIGSAMPDLWLALQGPTNIPPGEQAAFLVRYGNRGGVPASSGQITVTLPAGVSFVSATPWPISLEPVPTWQVGNLPAGSDPGQIVITTTLGSEVTVGQLLEVTAGIENASPELELHNNYGQVKSRTGYVVTLPFLVRSK
jgi:uncharacterized repeat protein (TIGR01451 family)